MLKGTMMKALRGFGKALSFSFNSAMGHDHGESIEAKKWFSISVERL